VILESASLQVKPGETAAFEVAFATAERIIASMPGYRSHELQRCLERAGHYLLLVHWDSVEAHETGFRKSAPYQEWKRLLHHFYDPFPTVLHYERIAGIPAPDESVARASIAVVERQLAAYNARDIEAFAACFSEDVEVWRPPATEPALRGTAAFRAFYAAERFSKPGLHAQVLGRIVMGAKVFDHERIHGVREAPFEMTVAYEIEGGIIRRVYGFAG
jgi:heme-degrading monooxygenase HmoA